MPERDDAIPGEAIVAFIIAIEEAGETLRGSVIVDGLIAAAPFLRAAQPEADRAPGEVDAALAWIADRAKYLAEPAWTLEGCALVGKQMYERATEARAALRSEQGQSRDDTVTLAEAVDEFFRKIDANGGIPCCGVTIYAKAAARLRRARFGAGRAEGEGRD